MLQLITIVNHCHHFRGFVYQQACFSSDHRSIEIAVRPRKGSAAVCSRCHQPAPGYDQLPERRFEFMPCDCGLQAAYRELRTKRVLTAVGKVEVSRLYDLCSHCHTGQFPTDVELDIENTEISPGCVACRQS